MSNMLELPTDGEFRPTNPSLPRSGAAASPVFARPPTDPPSRAKPQADALEAKIEVETETATE